ncbi:PA1571 family protein [Hahella ganghwensis]|uniref:PA1571 family protein n=1 Tax=Hahella ganghwensis TaxID=286420 RepID=UPI000366B782|nr:PA1571 family protein [Hahella ganghwensis]
MYALSKEKKDDIVSENGSLNGASMIDENGNEVPITETMIQQALRDMEHAWEPWHGKCRVIKEK